MSVHTLTLYMVICTALSHCLIDIRLRLADDRRYIQVLSTVLSLQPPMSTDK